MQMTGKSWSFWVLYRLPIPYFTAPRKREQTISSACKDAPVELEVVKENYENPESSFAQWDVVFAVGAMIILFGFGCYIVIWHHLYTHDKGMMMILPDQTIRKRHRKNVMDLAGHAWTFGFYFVLTLIFASNPWTSDMSRLSANLISFTSYGIFIPLFQIYLRKTYRQELYKMFLPLLEVLVLHPLAFLHAFGVPKIARFQYYLFQIHYVNSF